MFVFQSDGGEICARYHLFLFEHRGVVFHARKSCALIELFFARRGDESNPSVSGKFSDAFERGNYAAADSLFPVFGEYDDVLYIAVA